MGVTFKVTCDDICQVFSIPSNPKDVLSPIILSNPSLLHHMPGPELGSRDTDMQRPNMARVESEQERRPCTLLF